MGNMSGSERGEVESGSYMGRVERLSLSVPLPPRLLTRRLYWNCDLPPFLLPYPIRKQ